jgi:hypothetical protein
MTARLSLAAHVDQCSHCRQRGFGYHPLCPEALSLLREIVLEDALLRDSARAVAEAKLPRERYGTSANMIGPHEVALIRRRRKPAIKAS